MPVGAWLRMDLPGHPGVVVFTYIDPQMGFSAQTSPSSRDESSIIIRYPQYETQWSLLTPQEVHRLSLETPPYLVEFYGPQPEAGTICGWWYDHPRLQGRFHANFPYDQQVLVHDGGPRITDRRPEIMWDRIFGGGEDDVFTGRVLNRPHHLTTVSVGSQIKFIVPQSGEYPLRVTEQYLQERSDWDISPCNKCGLSELFDPPSALIKAVFPHTPDEGVTNAFSAFCGYCGGM